MPRKKLGDRVFGKYAVDEPVEVIHRTWIKLEWTFAILLAFCAIIGILVWAYVDLFQPSLGPKLRYWWELFFYIYLDREATAKIIKWSIIIGLSYIVMVFAITFLKGLLNFASELRREL